VFIYLIFVGRQGDKYHLKITYNCKIQCLNYDENVQLKNIIFSVKKT